MKKEFLLPLKWLFNLGVKSGLPKYVSFFGFLQISTLLIPEEAWRVIGVNAADHLYYLPEFVQEHISGTRFQNSMFVFWILSPFTLVINSSLFLKTHLTSVGYSGYLARRESRLSKLDKDKDYSLILGLLLVIFAYFWITVVNQNGPSFLGGYTPMKNRFVMMLIHGNSIALVLPAFVTLIVLDLRANLTHRKQEKVDDFRMPGR